MGALMSPSEVLDAIRDLVSAAEEAGWDIGENREILQRGRDAYADLQIFMADAYDDDSIDPDGAFLRAFMETEATGSSSDLAAGVP